MEQSFPQSTKRFQLESWAPILQEEGAQMVGDVEKKELAVLTESVAQATRSEWQAGI